MSPKKSNKKTPTPDLTGALFLIDGNSLAYRAFYALPETIATSDGFPTNALYGFTTMLVKILTDYRPAGVVVAWDAGKKVFRHEEYKEYKAHRKPMPDNLSQQFPHLEELVEAFGFESLKKEGYEADDILATLVREAREQGQKAVVVTADRDALQLVGGGVYVMTNAKGISEVKVYDPEAVEERYGISPDKVPDFIGLKGDSSDNIPGIPGVGDKTAAELLSVYASLEELLEHTTELKGKRRQLLEEFKEQALLSKELATLNDEVPLEITADTVKPGKPDRTRLRLVLTQYEFNSLLRRLEELKMVEAPEGEAHRLEIEKVDMGRLAQALTATAEAGFSWEGDGDKAAALYTEDGRALVAEGAISALETAAAEAGVKTASEAVAAAPRYISCHGLKALYAAAPSLAPVFTHDTMVAAYLLKPSARTYELEQLAAAVDIRVEAAPDAPHAGLAAAAAQAFHLARSQRQQLDGLGMTDLFEKVEMPLVGVLAAMERTGVRVDLARLGELAAKVSDQLEQLADEIYALAGGTFNIDSPKQLAEVLFEKLKLPPGKKTKTGYSTDASVLKGLKDKHPIIAKVESYRELAKLSNTYITALPRLADPDTWRVHTTFNQTVTATGRLSSSDPNLQNIPIRTPLGEKIRDCFIAEDGNLLVAADYSQVELRIMAHLSEEPKLREAFAKGEDIHRATAAEVFGLKPEEVTGRERGRAKAVNFGIMYGISPFGLSEQLGIPREEAQQYIETYFERYGKVAEFCGRVIRQAAEDGYVATIRGRRRPVPELKSGDERVRRLGERLAVNTVIQGSAADIMKVAMVNCHRALGREGLKAQMVLQVHDELVFEAPEAEAETVAALARREMTVALELDPPLEVDVGIGETWLQAK